MRSLLGRGNNRVPHHASYPHCFRRVGQQQRERYEEAMTTFARAHPEYVQTEMEFYWNTDAEQWKWKKKKKENAGSSSVVNVNSDDESDRSDD